MLVAAHAVLDSLPAFQLNFTFNPAFHIPGSWPVRSAYSSRRPSVVLLTSCLPIRSNHPTPSDRTAERLELATRNPARIQTNTRPTPSSRFAAAARLVWSIKMSGWLGSMDSDSEEVPTPRSGSRDLHRKTRTTLLAWKGGDVLGIEASLNMLGQRGGARNMPRARKPGALQCFCVSG